MEILVSNLVHNGVGYVNASPASLIASGVPESVVLDSVKPVLRKAVDEMAETARLALITAGVGQAMEYDQTRREAVAALAAEAAGKPIVADAYPMLAASLGIDVDPQTDAVATDVLGVARGVMAARDGWVEAGAVIRRVRLVTKAAIDAATTFDQAARAVASADWPKI